MTEEARSRITTARLAGALYLLLVVIFPFGLIYVPSQIMVSGDAAATANNLLANEFLFRTSVAGNLIAQVIFVLLVLVLYRLLKQVNQHQARLMVALVIAGVPIAFLGDIFKITALITLKGGVLASTDPVQMYDLAGVLLETGNSCIQMVQLFWGLWLIPFGFLVYRSGFIPRILGVLLMINGIAYMILCFTFLLLPDYQASIVRIATPFLALELPMVLWLLIKGVKQKQRMSEV